MNESNCESNYQAALARAARVETAKAEAIEASEDIADDSLLKRLNPFD